MDNSVKCQPNLDLHFWHEPYSLSCFSFTTKQNRKYQALYNLWPYTHLKPPQLSVSGPSVAFADIKSALTQA